MGIAQIIARILIHCDNSAVVSIIQMGRTEKLIILAVARNIWLITTTHDINLTVVHIPGKANVVADLLSRWFILSTYNNLLYLNIANPQWYYVCS